MPNHITNELKAPVHILAALHGETLVDFNRIMPMPESLKDNEPDMGVIDWAKIAMGLMQLPEMAQAARNAGDLSDAVRAGNYRAASESLHFSNVVRMLREGPFPKDFTPERFESFIKCCRAIKDCGYTYWYDWQCDHWGTKWNAYDIQQVNETTIRFNTAWAPPLPIIEKLVNQFAEYLEQNPDATFEFSWADEDSGNNCGHFVISRDGMVQDDVPNGSPAAYELWIRLKHDGVCPDYYRKLDDGHYEYVEEEDTGEEPESEGEEPESEGYDPEPEPTNQS